MGVQQNMIGVSHQTRSRPILGKAVPCRLQSKYRGKNAGCLGNLAAPHDVPGVMVAAPVDTFMGFPHPMSLYIRTCDVTAQGSRLHTSVVRSRLFKVDTAKTGERQQKPEKRLVGKEPLLERDAAK